MLVQLSRWPCAARGKQRAVRCGALTWMISARIDERAPHFKLLHADLGSLRLHLFACMHVYGTGGHSCVPSGVLS
eukprot:4250616-Lingulodinium_polyedra.AAC.1